MSPPSLSLVLYLPTVYGFLSYIAWGGFSNLKRVQKPVQRLTLEIQDTVSYTLYNKTDLLQFTIHNSGEVKDLVRTGFTFHELDEVGSGRKKNSLFLLLLGSFLPSRIKSYFLSWEPSETPRTRLERQRNRVLCSRDLGRLGQGRREQLRQHDVHSTQCEIPTQNYISLLMNLLK